MSIGTRLNHFDLLVPDGQPVRWVLNLLYKSRLAERVYGPELTRRLCQHAAEEEIGIFLYGSTSEILRDLQLALETRYPGIKIMGAEPSQFRRINQAEKEELIERIRTSGAEILFVGLGCPRQEVFAYELSPHLSMPILAVGAAFPFLAGHLSISPAWMQRWGLEWLYRLSIEPRRLWRRYLYLNPAYLTLVVMQALGIALSPQDIRRPVKEELFG